MTEQWLVAKLVQTWTQHVQGKYARECQTGIVTPSADVHVRLVCELCGGTLRRCWTLASSVKSIYNGKHLQDLGAYAAEHPSFHGFRGTIGCLKSRTSSFRARFGLRHAAQRGPQEGRGCEFRARTSKP